MIKIWEPVASRDPTTAADFGGMNGSRLSEMFGSLHADRTDTVLTTGFGRLKAMPRLTEPEYKATMDQHPVAVGSNDAPPIVFWPYFDAIPHEDFGGHDFAAGEVSHAWTMPASNMQHVLVRCPTPNVFLVLVLDLSQQRVHGHYLLDLNKVYGLS